MKQSPELKNSKATANRSEPTSAPPTLSLPQVPPILSDIYPTLTKEGYYTDPSLEDIRKLQPSGDGTSPKHLYVKDFTIGRTEVGRVVFDGETDIAHLNLDKLVEIGEKDVTLSADQPGSARLNKPATVYFENVYPEDETMAGHEALIQSLQELCKKGKQARQFISYRLSADYGQFIMKVEKFY